MIEVGVQSSFPFRQAIDAWRDRLEQHLQQVYLRLPVGQHSMFGRTGQSITERCKKGCSMVASVCSECETVQGQIGPAMLEIEGWNVSSRSAKRLVKFYQEVLWPNG